MLFRPPLYKRILSRVVFYSGLVVFLWVFNYLQTRDAELQVNRAARSLDVPAAASLTSF